MPRSTLAPQCRHATTANGQSVAACAAHAQHAAQPLISTAVEEQAWRLAADRPPDRASGWRGSVPHRPGTG